MHSYAHEINKICSCLAKIVKKKNAKYALSIFRSCTDVRGSDDF